MSFIHHRPDQIGGKCPHAEAMRCTTLTSRCKMPCPIASVWLLRVVA